MADSKDFKVIGKGHAKASDEADLRYKKLIEGAITKGISKAVFIVRDNSDGKFDQTKWGAAMGSINKDNPSGILGKTC